PAHRHPKSAFIYATVLEGEITSPVNSGPRKTYKAGEIVHVAGHLRKTKAWVSVAVRHPPLQEPVLSRHCLDASRLPESRLGEFPPPAPRRTVLDSLHSHGSHHLQQMPGMMPKDRDWVLYSNHQLPCRTVRALHVQPHLRRMYPV